MKRFICFFLICLSSIVYAEDDELVAANAVRLSLSRSDSLPSDRLGESGDHYMEGYIQALIDAHYYEYNVLVLVQEKVVYLFNLPNNSLVSESIFNFVQDMPDVELVKRGTEFPDKELMLQEEYVGRSKIKGIWFPQSTLLYQPMIANPRNPVNSAAYRVGDDVMGNKCAAVSLGDVFPIFRWRDVFPAKGDLQLDIEGVAWSNFDMWSHDATINTTAMLMNTDYMVGCPLSYAFDRWSFRLRPYHISSHLGDEFLQDNPGYPRVNPSFEAIDFFTSYQFNQMFRLYGGTGWIFHSDETYPLKPFYVEYGAELRIPGLRSYYHQLYGAPFVAVHFRNWQAVNWILDTTLALGYEWSKLQGVGRKIRLFGEYHNGYSEGEFFKEKTRYVQITVTYGY